VIVVNIVFAVGLAYPSALIGVWFPDVRLFTTQAMRMLYFAAPGVVALSEVSGRTHQLMRLNPLTALFESYRDVLIYGRLPALWMLLYPAGLALLLLAASLPVYRRDQHHFAKVIA